MVLSKKIFFVLFLFLSIVLTWRLIMIGFPLPNAVCPILLFLFGSLIIWRGIREYEKGRTFYPELIRTESPRKFLLSTIANMLMGAAPVALGFYIAFFLKLD